MKKYGTKHPVCKFLMIFLLSYIIAAGCSGTTHSYGEVTFVKIPLGHTEKTPENKQHRTKPNKNFLPGKLGELNLIKVIEKEEATRIINNMHGKNLDDCKNLIAHYGNNPSKNILYISVYKDDEKAKENLKGMAMKMANGSPVFSPLTYSNMGENVHFETDGMGLKHYFYRTDNILIWWQVEPDKAEATYNDLLKFDFTDLK